MADRKHAARIELLRWVFLLIAVVVLVAFLVAQRQSADVTYGESPSSGGRIAEGDAGELSGATVPSVREMTERLTRSPVVRLPGSIATWDERAVRAASGDKQVRIIVAPPGLPKAARDRVKDVENATVHVIGTEVGGDIYGVSADRALEWRDQFASGDVTDQIVTLLTALRDKELTAKDTPIQDRRDPSAAELALVTKALRTNGFYIAPGASLTDVPKSTDAFGDTQPLYVALPQQQADRPLVHFGPSLAKEFPGRPILVMYGSWIEYDGPLADDFSDVATASFYGQFADRLSKYAYPQRNVLGAYLNRVTVIRYTGVFDRPLPYTPFDPLRVAVPALPWIFTVCAVVFLALSARTVRRPARRGLGGGASGVPARLAGLTALALELSGLARDEKSSASLARAITQLNAVRDGMAEAIPPTQQHTLLDEAESELDDAARSAGWPDYRPGVYLQWRLV